MGTYAISNAHGKSIACAVRRVSDGHFVAMYKADVADNSVDTDKLIENIASFHKNTLIIKEDSKVIKTLSMDVPHRMKEIMEIRAKIANDFTKEYIDDMKKYLGT